MDPLTRPPRRRRCAAALIAVASLLWGTAGCAVQGLSFKVDERVTITKPDDREKVPFPITIEWEVSDFTVVAPAKPADGATDTPTDRGYFGVFLDRAPQPPGQTVEWFSRDDRTCRPADGCPNRRYLAVRGVYTTAKTEFVIPRLPLPASAMEGRPEQHEVTIVLLDPSGRRIGESAFSVRFEVDRQAGRG